MANGFPPFALVTLNTLIGNLHWKGGTFQGGGGFPEAGPGLRYDLRASTAWCSRAGHAVAQQPAL